MTLKHLLPVVVFLLRSVDGACLNNILNTTVDIITTEGLGISL